VARVKANRGFSGSLLAAGAALAVLFAGLAPAWGQGTGRPPSVSSVLQAARECYARGDYEAAADYYRQVQASADELTPAERNDLGQMINQNKIALQQRREGRQQIRLADDDLRRGQLKQASALLKALTANPYLASADRQAVNRLNDRLRAATAGTGASPTVAGQALAAPAGVANLPPDADARTVLGLARAALQRGDLDQAEQLARYAQKMGSSGLPAWMQPWKDTPARVLRDVDVARARQAAARQKAAEARSPSESTSPLQSVKSLFGFKSSPPTGSGTEKGAAGVSPSSNGPATTGNSGYNTAAKTGASPPPDTRDPATRAKETAQARQLVRDGYQALQKNDFEKARLCARRAQALRPDLRPGEPTPERLLADLQGQMSRIRPAAFADGVKETPVPTATGTAKKGPGSDQATQQARELIRQAYQALNKNDVATARRLAEQASALHPDLQFWEDNPEKLLHDISRHSPVRPSTPYVGNPKAPPVQAKEDPHAILHAARELYAHGKLEEAEKGCARAATVPGAHWGLFEDNPDKLRADIQQTRSRRDREEAAHLLVEARKLYEKGKLKEAKELAARARQKHGPYTILDLGDRPDRLLAEIELAEMKQRTVQVPPAPGVAVPNVPSPPALAPVAQGPSAPVVGVPPVPGAPRLSGTVPPPAPTVPAADTRQQLARQRILMLLAEAHQLHRQDRLIEARQKAVEAQEVASQAVAFGLRFGPEEETPAAALSMLAAACGKRVQILVQHADEMAALGPANPRHFDEADQDLGQARQLAVAFGLDLKVVEEKTARLQQLQAAVAQGVPPVATVPPQVAQTPAPAAPGAGNAAGRRLLDDARRELQRGKLEIARRMAETAMDPIYGLQKEAADLIRSIDQEEVNQKILISNRNADAVRDAYINRDFRQAATISRSIDWRSLSEDRKNRLKEILSMPEMQAALNGKDAPATAPGKATITDLAKAPDVPAAPGGAPATGDDFERFRGLEEVAFIKLRDDGIAVQIKARETFNAGNAAAALEMLRDYLDRLQAAQLDPERTALLRRPVEQRRQQLLVLQAQQSLDREILSTRLGGGGEERRAKQLKHKQDEVSDLMKRYQTLFKEHKFDEALVLAKEAHEIDPDNVAVDAAIQVTRYRARLEKLAEMKEEKSEFFLKALDNPTGPLLDVAHNPLAFSKDKADIERMRKRKAVGLDGFSPARRDEKERLIEQKLLEPVPPVSFTNTPLQKVIDDLSALTGVNIIADKTALEEHSIRLDEPLSLKVSDISLKSALNILLKQAHLTYVIKDQVLQVTTEDYAIGSRHQVIYPVADLVIPVEDHAPPLVSDLPNTLERFNESQMMGPRGITAYDPLHGIAGGAQASMQDSTNNPAFASSHAGQAPQWQTSKKYVNNTIQDNLIKLIKTTIAPESWDEMGGKGTIQYYPLGMGLVVNQTQDIQEQVADLLAALRRLQDLEVAIEIRLVAVSESFYERMGLNFDLNILSPSRNSAFVPQLTQSVFTPFPFINSPQPQKFGPVGLTPAGTFTPDLAIPIAPSSFGMSIPPFGNYPGTLGADGGLTLGLAFLSDIQVFMLLEAAQGDVRTNTMQAPRVTVFNGQSAFISVNTFQFFLIGVNINTAADQIFFTPLNQAVPLGVNLFVTPVVTADRRFVRLSLAPTMTNLASASVPLVPVQIPVPQMFDDNFVNPQPVIFQMFFQQPTFETITVNTTVLVPDGGTVLLGGLKTMNEGRNEFGPPILSNIPYINRLFKNTAYGRDARSLMIMVTPRIIINEEEEQIFLGEAPPLPRP
jgi:type II secretory pathway component GspD/PulD (secretin)/tetratricopeptide (TPR) repeat protein